MLKKLFATALLLAFTVAANATPIKSIDGHLSVGGNASITLDTNGSISEINFESMYVSRNADTTLKNGKVNDFAGLKQFNFFGDIKSPLIVANILATNPTGILLWTIGDFAFHATSIARNSTDFLTEISGMKVIGMLSHKTLKSTEAEYFFSAQRLSIGVNDIDSFSAIVTSPAPVDVSEPGTLAIFGLALIGFAATRKKKSA